MLTEAICRIEITSFKKKGSQSLDAQEREWLQKPQERSRFNHELHPSSTNVSPSVAVSRPEAH